MTSPGCSPDHLNTPSLVPPPPPSPAPQYPSRNAQKYRWRVLAGGAIRAVLRGALGIPPTPEAWPHPLAAVPYWGGLGYCHTPGSCPCCWVPVRGPLNKRDASPQYSPVILLTTHDNANSITTHRFPRLGTCLPSSSTTLHALTPRLSTPASLPSRSRLLLTPSTPNTLCPFYIPAFGTLGSSTLPHRRASANLLIDSTLSYQGFKCSSPLLPT